MLWVSKPADQDRAGFGIGVFLQVAV